MKYYSYSMKDLLSQHFGEDALSAMRKPHNGPLSKENEKAMLPLAWQYADEQSRHLFLDDRFLTDTIMEEDYIAYLYQRGNKKGVLLMFMLFEKEAPFVINHAYVCSLIKKWETAGYDAKILSQCISVEYYGSTGNFHFGTHSLPGFGANIYRLVQNGDKKLLVFDMHSCWPIYYEKMVWVSKQEDIGEYQCLFEPDVAITVGDKRHKETLSSGLDAVKDFFRRNSPCRICYTEFKKSGIYNTELLAGEKRISIWVNTRNLISEINVSEREPMPIIAHMAPARQNSLQKCIPGLCEVRALSVEQIHGYGIQMRYTDGSIRNYYLKMFDAPKIPNQIELDGVSFDEKTLGSVTIERNGVRFENGYTIAAHILYYRSYRQLQPRKEIGRVYPLTENVLQAKYMLPLKEFKDHFSVRQFWGEPGECYGPMEALLDQSGNRISDVSFYGYGFNEWHFGAASRVRIEPSWKYGLLQSDGKWLVPPIYENVDSVEGNCVKASRYIDGELKKLLITADGKEVLFDHKIDTDYFCDGLCPFNTADGPVEAPKPGYYWEHDYDDVTAGLWGFVNIEGETVVQPQYVYAVGFYNGGGNSVVARLVDGKLLWGAIDTSGREVIPCIYESLYTVWGDAFAFRNFGEEKYGVMDHAGKVIAEPQFDFFEAYNEKHRLLTVGEHGDALGVYSIDEQRMIIPVQYDYIDYGESIISCEVQYTCSDHYYDYFGRQLDFSAYERVSEYNGLLRTYKNGKYGYLDVDGEVIVPNILECSAGMDELELYRKGYQLTGSYKQYGFATIDGHEILPQKYAEIFVRNTFLVASERAEGNWGIRDTLYTMDGKPILQGPYRNMSFDRTRQELTVETPEGKVYFQIAQG